MEGTDHVLVLTEIHTGLAADGGIHLGQQRGGDLNKADAPHVGRCGKTSHIPDDAAAEGNQKIIPIKIVLNGPLVNLCDAVGVLILLSSLQDQGIQCAEAV